MQITTEYEVHPTQLKNWRAIALQGLPSLFEKQESTAEFKAAYEQQQTELYAEIGKLTTQVAWLKHGRQSVAIATGEDIVSDPITLQIEAFSNLAISCTVVEGDIHTGHFVATLTSYVSTSGAKSVSAIPSIEELLPAYPLLTTA